MDLYGARSRISIVLLLVKQGERQKELMPALPSNVSGGPKIPPAISVSLKPVGVRYGCIS